MSAVLIRPNNEYYVIEVVKKISRSMPTEITTNPVETGESISDHIILKNKTWVIDGLISDATFVWEDSSRVRQTVSDSIVELIPDTARTSISVTANKPLRSPGGEGSLTSTLRDIAGSHLGFLTQFTEQPIKVDVIQSGSSPRPPEPVITNSLGINKRAFRQYELLVKMRDAREILTLSHSSGEFPNLVIKELQIDRDSSISTKSFVFTLHLEQIQVVDRAKTVAIAKLPKSAPKPKAFCSDATAGKTDAGQQTPTPKTEEQLKAEVQSAALVISNIVNDITIIPPIP